MKNLRWLQVGLGIALLASIVVLFKPSLRSGATGRGNADPPVSARSVDSAKTNPLLSVAACEQGNFPSPKLETAVKPTDRPVTENSAPEAIHAEFANWVGEFLSARASGTALPSFAKGSRLAAARRAALAQAIKEDPQSALEMAVPWQWREVLPPEITAHFEEVVSARGNLDVFCALPLPGPDYREFRPGLMRYATINGRTYQAYVYGKRARQMSQRNIAIEGIAVDNLLAISEEPVRVLDADETRAMTRVGKAPASAKCALCGSGPVAGQDRLLVSHGGQLLDVCCLSHAGELGRTLAEVEQRGQIALASSGGDTFGGNSWWTSQPPASLQGSFGTKRVLYMRVVFRDDIRVPISEGEAMAIMDEVDAFYKEASYNKTALITTVTPVLTLPHPKLNYSTLGPGALLQDAMTEAIKLGYKTENYDQLILQFTSVPGYEWGGLGGGGVVWIQGAGVGLIVHELGHCYGLGHANFWETRRPVLPTTPQLPFDIDSLVGHDSIIGVGDDIEYGDIFDVMGSGGGEATARTNQMLTAFAGHFNAIGKAQLGWLTEAYIVKVATDGTNRIYVHDTPRLVEGRSYALRIAKDAQREYWISARTKVPNRWLTNGVELHWAAWQQAQGYSQLLDTTPGSIHGRQDAAIAVGRTYADEESKVYITPVARGGSGTNTWYDVVVFRGERKDNLPPVVTLSVSTNKTRPNQPITLTADAIDPNGDAMSFYWDLGDDTAGPNAASIVKDWATPGDYVVRCEVSDLRGGITSKHIVIRVGDPTTLRVSGFVVDNAGMPLRGVRVSNGSLTEGEYEYAENYKWTYTDSDGAFTLVGLTNGDYHVGAYINGYVTTPANFGVPITLRDRDASGLTFIANPLPRVTAEVVQHADGPTKKPGIFRLKRTGDTNTALQAFFLLGGSAAERKDYARISNSVVNQTNVVPTPFGPNTLTFKFYAVDFPTGVVETNITITPLVTNAPAGQDKDVALTVMYPLEVMRLELTNGEGGLLATNTNYVFFSDWEIRNVNGQETWFQNYTDYVPWWPGEARLRIAAQKATLPIVSLLASAAATENAIDAAQFTVLRSGVMDVPVTVQLTVEGTAVPGSDYEALPSSVVIPANASFVTIPVYVRPNLYLDGNRTVKLKIAADPAYQVGTGEATVTIADNDLPLVTITATQPVGSESGSVTAVMMVTRAGDMTRELTVNYLVSGTAVSGRDYRALPGAVTIPAGQPSAAIVVTPRDNGIRDGGNTVQVFISDSPTYNVGYPNAATVFIQDRALPVVTVRATDETAAEPSETGEFVLTRTGDTSRELEVFIKTGGTAKPFADYVSLGERVVFPRNASTVTLTVAPVDDRLREDQETVILEVLPGLDYYAGSPSQAVVTINDDDSSSALAVGFSFLSSTNYETPGQALIAVAITGNPQEDNPVTVDYKVTGGTAIPDVDYPLTSSTGRLMFVHGPDGGKDQYTNRTQLIPFVYTNDSEAKPDRTVVLTLIAPPPFISNWLSTNDITITNESGETITTNEVVTNSTLVTIPMNASFDVYQSHTLTILDDDASVITVEATDPVAYEQGLDPAVFTIKRTVVTNRAQKVRFQLSGLAANGSDYQTIETTVEIPPGWDSIQIPVMPVDDPVQEYIEDVKLTLLETPGAQIGDPSAATVTIIDNDGTVEFARTAYSVPENVGIANIPVRRTSDTNALVTVDFTVTAGTAVPDVDFVVTNGVLVFQPGETVKNLQVPVLDDLVTEPTKTVNLTLLNPSGGAALGGQTTAVLNIEDDDTAVEFAGAAFTVYEHETNAVVTLRRIGVLTNVAQITFVATNGTAVDGVDFVATNQTVSFVPGQTLTNVFLRVLDNTLIESNKTVLLTLLTNELVTTSVGPQGNATLTIVENDCAIQFAATNYSVIEYAKVVNLDVQRIGGTVHPVQVDYRTVDGTANSGRDYQSISGTITFTGDTNVLALDGSGRLVFQPGETNKTIQVRILDDNLGEGDELFLVRLQNPRAAVNVPTNTVVLGPVTSAGVTIIDDETPGQVDFAFNPGQGADGPVYALALQSDGKVVIGGAFTSIDGIILNRVARLHEDGYLDSFLTPGEGTDGDVHAIAVQPDGRILIGGDFRSVNGVPSIRLARLNADGSVHDGFKPGLGPDGRVRAIAVQPDGAILIGGDFNSVVGAPRVGIARLTSDGMVDQTFDPGAGAPGVYAIAVQPDGKILIAGAFTSAAGSAQRYIARLNQDGSLDRTFNTGAGPDGMVRSIALLADGRIVIGGDFETFAGISRYGVARLNADGSLDTAFEPPTDADGVVYAVGALSDGKVMVGGAFTTFGGLPLARFARLNPNGTVDTSFQIGTGANDLVRALVVQPDTAVVIGGDFTEVNGLDRKRIARIHGDEKFRLNTVQFSAAFYRAPENGTNAVITVVRGGDVTTSFAVNYGTRDGTAIAGKDYTETNGSLTFAAGETVKTFEVPILDNLLAEGDKTVGLFLTNIPSGFSLSARLTATLVIEDNESALAFSAPTYTVSEGAGVATITVRRTGPNATEASVDYETRDDTAVAGKDYGETRGTLYFMPGESEKSFDVPIIDNDQIDPDRSLFVVLNNPIGGPVLGLQSTAVLTITDNDRVEFYSLNIVPAIGGTVTPSSGSYNVGTVLSLFAAPDRDYKFSGWTGTINSAANPLFIVMDKNYTLKANFVPVQFTYTFEPPFTAANLASAPWVSSTTKPWQLQSATASGGRFALRSAPIGDGEDSTLSLVVVTRAGAGSFDFRVSSEANWDFFEFYVNGVKIDRWSGDVPWRSYQFNLVAGRNTLTWRYVKDNNFSSGLDAAFIDNLFVPLDVPDPTDPAARLSVIDLPSTGFHILLEGRAGNTYVTEVSSDLVEWQPISTNTLGGTTAIITDLQAPARSHRFYRAYTR
ncbi:MAG: PKD domain-containing protein [Verrucomicrobia bacterium]|nr:PKD domain-containing protein [Verrucomicrobiota bacterium]